MTTLAGLSLISSGKVREMYALQAPPEGGPDRLLMVASDRISTYDAVHPTAIPDKGKVLTGLSDFWFARTAHIVPNHLISATEQVPPSERGRALVVRRLSMLPVECVVRGYITGSGWTDYQATGRVSGIELPAGLRESEQLPEPIFTPSTKADVGHDEAIDFDRAAELVGDRELMRRVAEVAVALYSFASAHARERGVILADTKFEFGLDDLGELVVGDEVLTPDSSRYWPLDGYEVGRSQPSFDKQYVRDWASASGWDRTPPAPESPTTSSRAPAPATSRPTSASPASPSPTGSPAPLPRRTSPPGRREGPRAHPSEGRNPRPPGRGRRAGPPRPRLRRRGERPRRPSRRARRPRPLPAGGDVREAPRQPPRRGLRDRPPWMKFGVLQFPGSCDDIDALGAARSVADADLIWHGDRDLAGADAIVVPGGFSYGDYLRAGAIARFSPAMESVLAFASEGGLVLGICNGFQVLCEARLLPGALLPNANLRFTFRQVHLDVVQPATPFTSACPHARPLSIPAKHSWGRYHAAEDTLAAMEARGQVVLRYASGENFNGSARDIAGVRSEEGNVFGLMPHPEHAVAELVGGSTDGLSIFESIRLAVEGGHG